MQQDQDKDNTLYLMLGEMKGMLTSILSTLEVQKEDHNTLKENTDKRFNNHSDRITALERFKWQAVGIIALIPFAFTLLGWFFFK